MQDAAYKTEDGSWYFRLESVSGVRQAEQEGPERDGRRRARGRGRVREGLGARLCAVEGSKAGRARLGYGDWARAAGLAH